MCKHFLKDVARLRSGLTGKLQKTEVTNPFTWNDYDIQVVRQIKEAVKNILVLDLSHPSDHFILETDASDKQWGVVYS